ncbi:MAG TPA: response regulator [Planctomycetota bacterium]|nr:response regulator [Planctomycetota bacterium]
MERDDTLREALVVMLDDEGFSASGAPSGAAAIERIEGVNPPDVVLLDLDGLDGERDLAWVTGRARRPALVLLSSDRERVHSIAEAEDRAFVVKPINLEKLVAVISIEVEVRSHRARTGSRH